MDKRIGYAEILNLLTDLVAKRPAFSPESAVRRIAPHIRARAKNEGIECPPLHYPSDFKPLDEPGPGHTRLLQIAYEEIRRESESSSSVG